MGASDVIANNRAYWDELARVHGQDDYYDSEALLAGADSMVAEERAAVERAVGSVDGLDVIHVQCHIGFDTISLARRGARVTGVDFSAAALDKAARLATRAGVETRWIQSDVLALPSELDASFDLAYSTMGVLCWISDVGAWMRSVASVLRPGGRLVLIDSHPLLNMVADEPPFRLEFPYADAGPFAFEDGSYAVPDAKLNATTTIQFCHSLGEIVTAAVAAGLQINGLTEHLEATAAPRSHVMTRDPDGQLRLRVDGQALPILFTLLASRP